MTQRDFTAETESRALTRLALPVMLAQLGSMAMGTVDTLMVARVGVDSLAAAALGNAWVFAVLLTGQGIVHGMDPIVTQAHGAGRGREVALTLQRAVVVCVALSLPMGGLFALTGPVLGWSGQEPALTELARSYVWAQIPSLPAFLLFVALRQYLQGRELVRPAMWVIAIANIFNALLNWSLIFGHLGSPALGLLGAGIATALSRWLILLMLVGWVLHFGLQRDAWVPWSREALAWGPIWRMLRVGMPISIQMSLEIWAFSLSTLLVGHLGAVSVAAHAIAINLASLSFMMPLGISQGAVTRVGNLLGARHPKRAQHSAWVAMGMGAGVMAGAALAFITLRDWLPGLYSPDPDVVVLAASILPIAAAFQIFDGIQVVGCGVLRGMGHTRPAAWFNLLGYWVLGLPLAATLSLGFAWGLSGIWWGLCLGLGVVAGLLVAWIRFRGPAHAVPFYATQP